MTEQLADMIASPVSLDCGCRGYLLLISREDELKASLEYRTSSFFIAFSRAVRISVELGSFFFSRDVGAD
jgi:hypothetical protein